MRIVLLLFSLLLFVGCGSHQQSNAIYEPEKTTISGEETDPTLLLINAVEAGDIMAVEKALVAGGDVNTLTNDGLTLLMVAVRSKQFAMVDLLMGWNAVAEAEVLPKGEEEKKQASDFISGTPGSQAIMAALLAREPISPENTNNPLLEVIEELQADNVRWLLSKGANPNYVQHNKRTPLIVLFSLRGIEGERFQELAAVFAVLVSHQDIDLNLTVRRNNPLKKAKQRLRQNPEYQTLVDQLIARGASEE